MDGKRTFHWAWVILAICFVNLFISYSVRLGYGVVLPEMIRTLKFGRTAGGSIYNFYLLTYISITPLTGYLTDRLGARRVITVCLLIFGMGVFLMGTVQALWSACFIYAIVGLGATGLWTPVISLVQRWFAFHRRGFALGILSTGYGLGFATMGAVFPWIVTNFNWRYAWFFLGGLAFSMVAVNAVFLRSDPVDTGIRPWGDTRDTIAPHHGDNTPADKIVIRDLFKNSRFWLIGFSYFAIAFSLYGMTTFMVDFAKYQLNLPLEKASFLATIHGICQIIGVLTVLPLSDYLGRKRTIIISNAIISISLVLILLVGESWGMLCIAIGIMAVFYGPTWPIYGACAGDYFPREMMATVIGIWTPFYGSGAIMTHWISGMLRDTSGVYHHAFILNMLMAVIATVLMCLVRKQ
ncbi:MAG: MFS transporter [Desulfobacterales bacterium]